jgi:hypothetical protein
MQDLTGRTAFVIGAASGIGLGIATALSRLKSPCDPERNSYSFLTQQKGHSGCLTANLSPRDT